MEVGILNDCGWDAPVFLGRRSGREVSVNGIESFEGIFSENQESANMSAWGESENVQVVDVEDLDTWDVSKGSDDTVVLSVDDGWSKFLNVFSVSRFTSAGSHSSGGVDSFDIVPSAELLQKIDCLFCFFVFLSSVADDQWDFWNFVDFVAFSHDQSWYSSGGDGGAHGVPLLGDVDLPVPPPPGLGGGKHATSTAHVTEGSLAGPDVTS